MTNKAREALKRLEVWCRHFVPQEKYDDYISDIETIRQDLTPKAVDVEKLREVLHDNGWGLDEHETLELSELLSKNYPTIQEGYVAVPIEPTEKMVLASQVYVHSFDVKLIYKAMIKAAKESER